MPPSLHSAFGASQMKRMIACPPSARLAQKFAQKFGTRSSVFAEEGTKAHELAELKLRRAIYDADGMTSKKFSEMSKQEQDAYQGINSKRFKALVESLGEIPDDMDSATNAYCDVIMEKYLTAKDKDPSTSIFLETRIDYGKWVKEGFGTADCIIVSDTMLEVCDYKHGKGIPVDAEDNPQIRTYALGAVARFGDLFSFDKVRGTIIQPRLDSISEEVLSLEDLLHWADSVLVPAAELAYLGKGEFGVGDHCRFCPVKAVCVARVQKAVEMFQYGLDEPGVIPDNSLPDILPLLDTAEDWIKDIREYAEKKALNGDRIYGYKLVHGKKPNRTWGNEDSVEERLYSLGYGKEQTHETKLRSVGNIEKLLGKATFEKLLGAYVAQGEGKPILVPESDARIEINRDTSGLVAELLG